MIELPPPSYEQTIQAIVRCDIPRANIRIAYEAYLQSDEVTVTDLEEVTDEKLRCLKAAVHPFYILTIQKGAQQAAFYELSERDDRPKRQAEAREWLRSRGVLERLPTYHAEQGLAPFAEALKNACGLEKNSALMLHGSSAITIRPGWLLSNKFEKSGDALYCLTQMFAASNADQHDIRFVFIGNEAVREGDES